MNNKKVVLITGTRKGIGRHLAEYYLSKSFIVVGCSRKETDFQSENYNHHILDINDEEKVVKLFIDLRKNYERLDILINNAGIASMNHILLTPLSTVENIFKTNFFGSFLFCREAAKIMKKNQQGRIVNLSSVAVKLSLEGEAIYASSKSALETFTKIFAKEVSELGITVNSIGLTPVETDLILNVPKEKIKELLGRLTIKRFTNFEDITNIIDFLIKEESNYITGQNINLGGV
ncbi:MAG: SDR family oxidoreductase [Bacteroidota bacterium]|nr:SDR family oxidoreductase [Bacteroidota bacterium]